MIMHHPRSIPCQNRLRPQCQNKASGMPLAISSFITRRGSVGEPSSQIDSGGRYIWTWWWWGGGVCGDQGSSDINMGPRQAVSVNWVKQELTYGWTITHTHTQTSQETQEDMEWMWLVRDRFPRLSLVDWLYYTTQVIECKYLYVQGIPPIWPWKS